MAKRAYKNRKIGLIVTLVAALIGATAWYFHQHIVAVLQPAGEIGQKERSLIFIALLLSAVVVIPVYIMAVAIAVRYREQNHQAKYQPDWDSSRLFESLWWGVPLLIITTLSVITWQSSHALDPYRALASRQKPLIVQVVSLDWKWLFIYPAQRIASVNMLELPVNRPVNFQITSDTVMNSFWVPQLGSQIYAMPGMSTQLHLMANKTGNFYGSSANISGTGFASMNFMTKAVRPADFSSWLHTAVTSSKILDMPAYSQLARPTQGYPPTVYAHVQADLYNDVVMKYMAPAASSVSYSVHGMSM